PPPSAPNTRSAPTPTMPGGRRTGGWKSPRFPNRKRMRRRMPGKAHNPGPLGELLAHIAAARHATETAAVAGLDNTRADGLQASPSAMLDEFQQLWGRIRTDSQLRQSLAAPPDDAGPLHSSTLLHRAMTLMQDVAPGYLQHF